MERLRPGAGRGLVVRPDDDPPHRDLEPVLPLPPVAAEPDLHLPAVHHHPVVVPGHTVPGRQDEPAGDQSPSTGPPSDASPGTSECGLKKRKFPDLS